MNNIEIYNDNYQNWKRYLNCKAQLIIADVPYNLSTAAYASNPSWYIGGDNKNGESELAGKSFFNTDENFKPPNLCTSVHSCLLKNQKKDCQRKKSIVENTLKVKKKKY